MDSTLVESYSATQVMRCIHIGLLCVQAGANDRPTIYDVSNMLSNEASQIPEVKQKSQKRGTETHLSETEMCSNTFSSFEVDAR
jgi:hypothetical protein